jgi:hypothetical protein
MINDLDFVTLVRHVSQSNATLGPPPCNIAGARGAALALLQQLRQSRHVRRDPPRRAQFLDLSRRSEGGDID